MGKAQALEVLTAVFGGEVVVLASSCQLPVARAEIAKLQRLLGEKTLERSPQGSWGVRLKNSGIRAHPCCPGAANEMVCWRMGPARSHVRDLYARRAGVQVIAAGYCTASTCTWAERSFGQRTPVRQPLQHALLVRHDLLRSMSCRGNRWENAVMERFFLSLKM